LKRFLVSNKLGHYCQGLVEMDVLTLQDLTDTCSSEENNPSTVLMGKPLSLTPREAKELISLMTNPRNPNSPRAKASKRTAAAEAAYRILNEQDILNEAAEKQSKILQAQEKIAANREKRLKREASLKSEQDALTEQEMEAKAEEEAKMKAEKEAQEKEERQRLAEEKVKEESRMKLFAKADKILQMKEAAEQAEKVRNI
jgi:signal transduction histidine kinase